MNEASPLNSASVVSLGSVLTRFMPLIILCLVLTAVDLHFVATKVGGTGFSHSVEASEGVVNGLPHWRLYQSRVLGPYTVDLISRSFAISYLAAQALFGAVLLLLAKLAIVLHRRRDQSSGPTVFMLLASSFLFALLVGRPWLYAWDFFGIFAFTLFVIFAIEERPWTWFVPLVLVAFLNRESAVFISAWMVMQGLLSRAGGGKPFIETIDWRMLAAGLITAACGLLAVHLLRETLLVREIGQELFGVTAPRGTDWFHWKLPQNLKLLWRSLTLGNLFMPWLFTLLPVGAMVTAAGLACWCFPRYTALCLCFLLLLMAVFMFGVVIESRVMLETIPFFSVFLPYLVCNRKGSTSVFGGEADAPDSRG